MNLHLLIVALLAASVAVAQVPNNNPSFTLGPDVGVNEDSGQYSQPAWATNINDNDGGTQGVIFTLVAANPALFQIQPTVTDSGLLSFTPARDQYGSTTVTVVLNDGGTGTCVVGGTITACPNGCSPLDCSKSALRTFTITIAPVNDCPQYTDNGDVAVDEDIGSVVKTGWASNVKRGPNVLTNEDAQRITFAATNDNNGLFVEQPKVVWSSTNGGAANLLFKPADNKCGQAKVTVDVTDDGNTDNGGCDTGARTTFDITVRCINDDPSFNFGQNPITVIEDSGKTTLAKWASIISPGAEESTQTVTFTLTPTTANTATLFDVQPAIDAAGTLTFTVKADHNTFGTTAYYYVQLVDSHSPSSGKSCNPITSCPQLRIIITPINDLPSFSPGGDVEVYEDLLQLTNPPSPLLFTYGTWATSIDVGNNFERDTESQTVSFTTVSSNSDMFLVQPAISPSGVLSFTLKPHRNGYAIVTTTIKDSESDAGNTASFALSVLPVNDAPQFTFAMTTPYDLPQGAGVQSFTNFITGVRRGPVTAIDENTQALTWQVDATPTSLFSVAPVVTSVGDNAKITFTIADGQVGAGLLKVTLKDDGGTARGGVDHVTQYFTFNVATTNTAPTFGLSSTLIRIDEDQYPNGYTLVSFAKDILPGEVGAVGTREALTQTVAFTVVVDDTTLFTAQPSVSPVGTLTFTALPHANGLVTCTVYITDSASPPLKSTTLTFTIHLVAVNDAPYFVKGADISIPECVATVTTVTSCPYTYAAWATAISNSGAGGLANEATQTLTFTVTGTTSMNSLFDVPITVDTTTGALSFKLKVGGGNSQGTQTLTLTLKDNGGTWSNGIDTYQVSFTFTVTPYIPPPSFLYGSSSTLSIFEDSGSQSIPDFLVTIKPGQAPLQPGASVSTILTFSTSSSVPSLFVGSPQVVLSSENTAVLRVEPAPHQYGEADLTVTIENTETGLTHQSFKTISVKPVNDAPTFAMVTTEVHVVQGSGGRTVSLVNTISAGPGGEASTQTLTFRVNCTLDGAIANTNNFFTVAPSIESGTGTLFFSLRDTAYGNFYCGVVLQDSGGTNAVTGATDTSVGIKYFSINVAALNHAPSFTPTTANISSYEDEGLVVRLGWASLISAGVGDEGQTLTFVASCTMLGSNPVYSTTSTLFVQVPTVSPQGDLSYSTHPDANGAARCTIFLQDDGAQTLPNYYKSTVYTVLINVLPVNDAPKFTVNEGGQSIVLYQDSGTTYITDWATQMSAGAPDEVYTQVYSFSATVVSTSLPSGQTGSLFDVAPTVNQGGALVLIVKTGSSGSASLQVCLADNGGVDLTTIVISRRGANSTCIAVMVTIIAINQAPIVGLASTTIQVFEDEGVFTNADGQVTITDFANRLLAGSTATEQVSQSIATVSVNCTCAQVASPTVQRTDIRAQLFAILPTVTVRTETSTDTGISTTNGDLKFGLKADGNGYCGACYLVVLDSGGGTTTSAPFAIKVVAVNDAPTFGLAALPATPTGIANNPTTLVPRHRSDFVARVDAFADSTATVTISQWMTTLLAGPPDEQATQNLTVHLNYVTPSLTSPSPTVYFAQLPSVDPKTGALSFAFRHQDSTETRTGFSTILAAAPFRFALTVSDSGGTQYNGVDSATGVLAGGTANPQIISVQLSIHVATKVTPPSVALSGTITDNGEISVLEDSGRYVGGKLLFLDPGNSGTAVSPTISDVNYLLSVDTPILFSEQPFALYPSGDVIFTPAADRFGSATVTVKASYRDSSATNGTLGGSATLVTAITYFTIRIAGVNDRPTYTATSVISSSTSLVAAITLFEDTPLVNQAVSLATAISPGPYEANQTAAFIFLSSGFGSLIAGTSSVTIDSKGALVQLIPAKDSNGETTLQFVLQDDGGTAIVGQDLDTSSPATALRVAVTAVNDPPEFSLGSSSVSTQQGGGATALTIDYSSGAAPVVSNAIRSAASSSTAGHVTLKNFVSNAQPGPSTATDELSSQSIVQASSSVTCTSTTSGVVVPFTKNPQLERWTTAGTNLRADLAFTLHQDFYGTLTCNVSLVDSGDNKYGGSNSRSQTFSLIIKVQNKVPTFAISGALSSTLVASPSIVEHWVETTALTIFSKPSFLTALSAGSAAETLAGQTVRSVEVTSASLGYDTLFTTKPTFAINTATGAGKIATLNFQTTNNFGEVNLSVVVIDSLGARSAVQYVGVEVTSPLPTDTTSQSALRSSTAGPGPVVTLTLNGDMGSFSRKAFQLAVVKAVNMTAGLPRLSFRDLMPSEVMVLSLVDPLATSARRQQAASFEVRFYFLSSVSATTARQEELDALLRSIGDLLGDTVAGQAIRAAFAAALAPLHYSLVDAKTTKNEKSATSSTGGTAAPEDGVHLTRTEIIIIVIVVVVLLLLMFGIIAACVLSNKDEDEGQKTESKEQETFDGGQEGQEEEPSKSKHSRSTTQKKSHKPPTEHSHRRKKNPVVYDYGDYEEEGEEPYHHRHHDQHRPARYHRYDERSAQPYGGDDFEPMEDEEFDDPWKQQRHHDSRRSTRSHAPTQQQESHSTERRRQDNEPAVHSTVQVEQDDPSSKRATQPPPTMPILTPPSQQSDTPERSSHREEKRVEEGDLPSQHQREPRSRLQDEEWWEGQDDGQGGSISRSRSSRHHHRSGGQRRDYAPSDDVYGSYAPQPEYPHDHYGRSSRHGSPQTVGVGTPYSHSHYHHDSRYTSSDPYAHRSISSTQYQEDPYNEGSSIQTPTRGSRRGGGRNPVAAEFSPSRQRRGSTYRHLQ